MNETIREDSPSPSNQPVSAGAVANELAALTAGDACIAEHRDVIVAAGPDTTRFLHGQLTQNVELLREGQVAWSLLLQPNGRFVSLVRLHRVNAETILVDVEAGQGQTALAALSRFLIRTKCTLTLHTDVPGFRVLAQPVTVGPELRLVSCQPWAGWLLTLLDPATPSASVDPPAGVNIVSETAAEAFRVQHGEPRFGFDLTETTLPSETSLQSCAIAFGKGCYTGQELVERIDSRGRVVRSLVRIESTSPLAAGVSLSDATGADRGIVTSAASVADGNWAGIALVRNSDAGLTVDGSPVSVFDLIDQAE